MMSTSNYGPQSLLKIKDLKVYIKDEKARLLRIVDGVSFEVKENEAVGLFGECGCGKTTTINAIMGLINGIPGVINGEIWFEKTNLLDKLNKICCVEKKDCKLIIKKDVKEWQKIYDQQMVKIRGNKIFLVRQGAKSNLNPFWKIKHQVAEIGKKNGIKIDTIFEKLEIKDKIEHYPHQLSGGECQRVLLTMGFASGAKLLAVDEPTVGIDEKLRTKIIELFREYKDKEDKEDKSGETSSCYSLLIISHDLQIIKEIVDKVVVMCSGEVVETGSKNEVIYHPKHPYTKILIESYSISSVKAKSLPTIKGLSHSLYEKSQGCRFYIRCGNKHKNKNCSSKEPNITGNTHTVRCHYPLD